MKSIYLLLLLPLFLFSCTSDGATKTKTAQKASTPDKVESHGEKLFPSIDPARLTMLWDSASNMDIIFYNSNFSISQSKLSDIRGMINTISPEVPDINPNCPPIGRMFFVVDGRNEVEADLVFYEGCHYYIFIEDGKQKYANEMTEQGVNFFNNVFKSVSTQMSQEAAKRQKSNQK